MVTLVEMRIKLQYFSTEREVGCYAFALHTSRKRRLRHTLQRNVKRVRVRLPSKIYISMDLS